MPGNNDQESEVRCLIQTGYRYALSLTHHRQNAEDLVQQASLKVLRTQGKLVGKNYLFTTIRNLFIDNYRRKTETIYSETQETQIIDPNANHVSAVDQKAAIESLLSTLRIEEREALFLNAVEGYTAAEIAKLTGQPRNTILSHISRAKSRLRKTQSNNPSDEVKTS